MEAMIPSYGKVWPLGHKETLPLLDGSPVVVQEKVDGSQFSFMRRGDTIHVRSKGVEQPIEDMARNKMFGPACEGLLDKADYIPQDFIFRGEVLSRPKHNTLTYSRVPRGHIALFDVEDAKIPGSYYPPSEVRFFATNLGIDAVPTFTTDTRIQSAEAVKEWLEQESFLGGVPIEGVVVKRYDHYDSLGHALKGKFVSERFKEVHRKDWKERNPGTADVIHNIVTMYATEARWEKSVQHLAEQGLLEGSPRDIGLLIRAVQEDVLAEAKEEIAEQLFKLFWRKGIGGGITRGLPEWYKERLLAQGIEEAA